MTSSPPEDHGQLDFFGVSAASREPCARDATECPHASQVTANEDPDSPLDRSSQLSWLPDPFTWTDEDCFAMLEGYLIDQLRLLGDGRASRELREEIIAWVAAPKRPLAALRHAPFSFQACCAAAAVDFEEMRERALQMFAPELLAHLD